MTAREIKQEIRATRKEMKELGIRKISCFNGGLTSYEYQANSKLFRLSVDLSDALKLEANVESLSADTKSFLDALRETDGDF